MGSLSPPSVHHICWGGGGTSGFISQAALPGFGWIFSEATRSISIPLALGGMLIDRRIRLEPGSLASESRALTIRPPCLPRFNSNILSHHDNANKRSVGSVVVSVVSLTPVFDEQTDDATIK